MFRVIFWSLTSPVVVKSEAARIQDAKSAVTSQPEVLLSHPPPPPIRAIATPSFQISSIRVNETGAAACSKAYRIVQTWVPVLVPP
ncbi:hypothetical protein BDV19DRAFT_361787, partial [Aspergillus venezuelensis]